MDFQQIKEHYFVVHRDINPSGIVPLGPDLSPWTTPHGREALGGSPFAPGATAPGPVRAEERVAPEHTPRPPERRWAEPVLAERAGAERTVG